MKSTAFALAGMLAASAASAQIVIDQTLTVEELVEDVLLGTGVQVSNITFNGQPGANFFTEQAASFDGTACNIGIDQGLILATGSALNAEGPNDVGSSTMGGGFFGQSDPDLVAIGSNATINDAAVLEFDFIPIGDSIQFDFVFSSDEYLEYVNSQFNDVFGFFLSGPNINGIYSNNSINIALVPGSLVPVTINNVNSTLNSQFYVDNADGFTPPQNTDPYYVQYDGFTVRITARAAVTCGEVHHIKLAVADAGDTAFDSAVFLEGGSFTSAPFVPNLVPGPGIVGLNTILESCFNVDFLFVRQGDSSFAATINLDVAGTATPGVDYSPPFPDQITFPPYVSEVAFTLNAPIDADGPEIIALTVNSESPCSADSLSIDFFFFIDEPEPLIAIGEAFLIDCGESVQLTPTVTGGYGAYTFDWSVSNSTDSTYYYTPDQVQDVTVLVTDTCGGTSTGFFAVELTQPPPITATISGPVPLIEGCDDANIVITRPSGTSGDLLITLGHLGAAQAGSDYMVTDPVIIPGGSQTVNATVDAIEDNTPEGEESTIITVNYSNACQQVVSDTVITAIVDAPPLELTTEELLIIPCGTDSVELVAEVTGGVGAVQIVWSNGHTGNIGYASNAMDGIYTVTVTDDCGHTVSEQVIVDPQCAIIVPNVFSPNGDGENDVFYIEGILASKSTVRIYNRWGQTVYESSNYQNNWAGTDLPDGTYYYEVIVDRDPEPYTGHVTILSNKRR